MSSPRILEASANMDENMWSRLRTYDSFEAPYLGQLTDIGCKQLQSVGKQLRKRNVDDLEYLPSIYDQQSSNLYYNCTNMKRTIHSADNLLSQLCMFYAFMTIFVYFLDLCIIFRSKGVSNGW